jgi:hypothetical protein
MLLSTLPDIPGRTYDIIAVVFSQTTVGPSSSGSLGNMFNDIIMQASGMGADAIVDIKMIAPGTAGYIGIVVVIGTAVKLR